MTWKARLKRLERKAGVDRPRTFILLKELDGDRWTVLPGGETMTLAEFEEEYKPSDRDYVRKVTDIGNENV